MNTFFQNAVSIFHKGGPIMWPLLLLSLVTTAVAAERVAFIIAQNYKRRRDVVAQLLQKVEHGDIDGAMQISNASSDYVARTLHYALEQRETGLSEALLRAANQELLRFRRGLPVLDTAITLAPLLGLFGTVTGMISAFNMAGGGELGAPTAITGGIAEALIATSYGLVIAMVALLPFNYLNSKLELAQHDLEDAGTHLEQLLARTRRPQ